MKYILLLAFIICPVAHAQGIAHIITTADGRKAILKTDGTWSYAGASEYGAASAPASVADGSIEFEAAIMLRNSEVRPVARAEFFLLDQSLETILSGAGFKTGWLNKRGTATDTFWHLVAAATRGNMLGGGKDLAVARAAVAAHTLAKVTSGFDGKGKFEGVKPGRYYVIAMHYHAITRQTPCWEMVVDVAAGKTARLVFGSDNATSWGY
jgi:hypothetical protein